MFCLECSYNLRGVVSGVCPECGREFEVGNEKSWRARPFNLEMRERVRLAGRVYQLGCLLIAVLCAVAAVVLGVMAVVMNLRRTE